MKRITVEFDGKECDAKRLADAAGLPWPVVYQRLQRGWSVLEAYSTDRIAPRPSRTVSERLAYHRKRAAWHAEQIAELEQKLAELL